jgi:hypothetical protein
MTPHLEGQWKDLLALSDVYTCYSSALATWASSERETWADALDCGLYLAVSDEGDGLYAFSHFVPGLAGRLGIVREQSDDEGAAAVAVLREVEQHGRAIVSGDGYHLPWHVAFGRRHVPHWFVVAGDADELVVVDPFTCRNDLGFQEPTLRRVVADEVGPWLAAVPSDDPVHALREACALGRDERGLASGRFRWLGVGAPAAGEALAGWSTGPEAIRLLSLHFRTRADDQTAYRQADDLWSVARHRAFVARRAAGHHGAEVRAWAEAHAAPVALRWSHVAPLHMQAALAVEAGRAPTGRLPETLADLAELEAAAAAAFPG